MNRNSLIIALGSVFMVCLSAVIIALNFGGKETPSDLAKDLKAAIESEYGVSPVITIMMDETSPERAELLAKKISADMGESITDLSRSYSVSNADTTILFSVGYR